MVSPVTQADINARKELIEGLSKGETVNYYTVAQQVAKMLGVNLDEAMTTMAEFQLKCRTSAEVLQDQPSRVGSALIDAVFDQRERDKFKHGAAKRESRVI